MLLKANVTNVYLKGVALECNDLRGGGGDGLTVFDGTRCVPTHALGVIVFVSQMYLINNIWIAG